MPTQSQIDKALKAGYTMEQINIEQATPGTVKRNAALGNPVYEQPVNGQYASAGTTRTQDVGQISTGVNAGGETLYNFGTPAPTSMPIPQVPGVDYSKDPRGTMPLPPNTAQPIGTNQPVPGSASSIFGPENTFENQYYKNLNDQYNTPIDEEAIRRQKQADYQAQLDSVKAIYADQLNQARVRGQGRQGSSSAIQARRGLLGSNVGEAMTNNIETLNVQEQDLVRQEEANAIAAIQGLIRSGANEEIAARKKAIKEGGESLLAYYSGAGDRKAKKTTDAAKKLLALGKDPTAISDADLATAGIDKNDLLAEFNTLSDAKIAADDKLAREEERRQLENIKLGAEGDKIAADINRQNAELLLKQIETGKAYVAGGFIFDGATNEVIGNAQAVARARSGGGGGGSGGGTGGGVLAGYINPTGKTSLDLQQVELPGKATEFSKKSYGFGTRMAESEDSIAAIENLYKTSGTSKEFLTSKLPSFLQSAEMQKFNQAKRNFVNAVLRNESGAVISPSEFDNADKQYFPQPGDTPEVLAQKAKNRDLVTSNMFASAGKDAKGNNIKDIYNVVKQQNTQTQPANTQTEPTQPGTLSSGNKYTVVPPQ